MKKTGERQVPDVPGTVDGIDIKHVQRYQWASMFSVNKKVYDIACGAGYGSLLLRAGEYTGFDLSKETVEYATKYYGNKSVAFFEADVCNMPNSLSKTDVIVSFETIEHIKDPETFLSWCSKHCDIMITSSPIRGSFGRSHFHLFEYRLSQFINVLQKHFNNVEMFVQKKDVGIIYPCLPEDKGVAVAVCQ